MTTPALVPAIHCRRLSWWTCSLVCRLSAQFSMNASTSDDFLVRICFRVDHNKTVFQTNKSILLPFTSILEHGHITALDMCFFLLMPCTVEHQTVIKTSYLRSSILRLFEKRKKGEKQKARYLLKSKQNKPKQTQPKTTQQRKTARKLSETRRFQKRNPHTAYYFFTVFPQINFPSDSKLEKQVDLHHSSGSYLGASFLVRFSDLILGPHDVCQTFVTFLSTRSRYRHGGHGEVLHGGELLRD